MKKINGFENVQESTSFKRLEPNAYVCKIMNVLDVSEKEYLKVSFDIAEGENKGYFSKLFKEDTRQDKKWPAAGSFIRSYKEKALPMFKGFTNALEKSNKNYTWDWDESKLKGKTIVLIIGDEEYLNQKGEKRTRNYVASVRSLEAYKAGDYTIPALKVLDESKVVASSNSAPADFVDPFGGTATTEVETPEKSQVSNNNPWDDSDDEFNPFN